MLLFLSAASAVKVEQSWTLTPSHAVPLSPFKDFLRHRFLLNVDPHLFLLFHPGCEMCLVFFVVVDLFEYSEKFNLVIA